MDVVSYGTLLVLGLVALGLTLLLAFPVKRLVTAIGWLDKPNWRKWHTGQVPLAGGLMIVCATLIMVSLLHLWDPPAWQLWAAAAMVFAIAFADDRYPIRARFRLAVQIVAAMLITVSAGWTLRSLGYSLGPFELSLGMLALPFTILGMAALTNAINMTDGLDGMAGGVVACALFWLMLSFVWVAQDVGTQGAGARAILVTEAFAMAKAIAILLGATLGFLMFNQRLPWRARAALFLGDGGSMMLGFTISALCVHIVANYGEFGMPAAAVGWIIAVPVFDLFSCILRRLAAGVTPMTPDRRHMHHLLVALGVPVSRAVPVLQVGCLLCGLVGVAGWRLDVPDYAMFWALAALFVGYHRLALATWKRLQPDADLVGRQPEVLLPSSSVPASLAMPAATAQPVEGLQDTATAPRSRLPGRRAGFG
ncbi:MAG: MraY family glycosyltransferase [Burkholderiaceae bacterium]